MSSFNASENLLNINSPDNSKATPFLSPRNFQSHYKSSFLLQTLQHQAEKREILAKCINKIRLSTQVKSFFSLTPRQLAVIDDCGSQFSNGNKTKQVTHLESNFEKSYYEAKLNTGKLRSIVLKILEKQSKPKEWIIKPSHPFIIFWNVLKLCFMLHIFLLFPLMDAFGNDVEELVLKQKELFLIEWIFLLFDIALRFNVSVYRDGQLIKTHKELAFHYLKGGFIIDSIGLFGFSLFFFTDFFYIRYIYFLKISEIKKFLKFLRYELDPQNRYNNHIKLITLFVTIFFLAHIIACLWVLAAHSHSHNWIVQHNLGSEAWYIVYIWSFYFAILTMTTVGYGDIVPINNSELIACILIVLLSSAIFAYTLNTITTVLKDIDSDKSQFNQEARIIKNYMIRKKCDTDLQRRALQYLKLMWKNGLNEQKNYEQKIFSKLSSSLQQEINLSDKGQMLLKVPFLVNNFSIDCIKELMQHIEEVYVQPDEIVSGQDGLFILYKGNAEICWGSKTHYRFICNMNQGDHYGLLNLFNIEQPKYLLKSKDFSIFYFIPTQTLIKVLKNIDNETFCMIKDQVINQNFFNLFLTCHLCRKEGHNICSDIVYRPNKVLAVAKMNKKQLQQRKKIQRNDGKLQIHRNFKDVQIETCQFIRDKRDLIKNSKSQIDSDDIEEEPESLDLQSSQSCRFNQIDMEERQEPTYPHNSPIQQQQTIKRGSLSKKSTMIIQTKVINMLRRNTKDCSINFTNYETINDRQQFLQQNVDSEIREQKQHYYNIDTMKQFTRYFKAFNSENVIKQINQKKRLQKKRLKRLERLF